MWRQLQEGVTASMNQKEYEVNIEPISITADSKEQAIEYAIEYFADSNFTIVANEIKEIVVNTL